MIRLWTLGWGDSSGLKGWVQSNGPLKSETISRLESNRNVTAETESEMHVCSFEGRERGPRTKECGKLLESGGGKEMDCAPESPEEPGLATAGFPRWDPRWTSDLQDCKILDACCFKPLSWWEFVTAATRNSYDWLQI